MSNNNNAQMNVSVTASPPVGEVVVHLDTGAGRKVTVTGNMTVAEALNAAGSILGETQKATILRDAVASEANGSTPVQNGDQIMVDERYKNG